MITIRTKETVTVPSHACNFISANTPHLSLPPQILTCCHLNCKCTLLHSNASGTSTPTPHPPTSLRFSIKIQTEIEVLKGSAPHLAGLCRCCRRIGGGGIVWPWTQSTLTSLGYHVLTKLSLSSWFISSFQPAEMDVPLILIIIQMKFESEWRILMVRSI